VIGGACGAADGFFQPSGIVIEHLVGADLDGWAVSYEADHVSISLFLEQAALHVVASGAAGKRLNFVDELVDVFELSIHRDIADVCDRIDLVKFVHDLGSDHGGRHFAEVIFVKLGEDLLHRTIKSFHGNRSLFACLDEATGELLAIECFAGSIAFYDTQFRAFDLLVRGVAILALQALAATTNRRPVFGDTGIENFVFEVTALNATHEVEDAIGRSYRSLSGSVNTKTTAYLVGREFFRVA